MAGHRGMVGSAIVRRLEQEDCEVIVAPREAVNLRDLGQVRAFFADRRPQAMFMAAATVGGILANATYPVEFLSENLEIANATITAAHLCEVEKLIFLGSTCIYPKFAPQPINEDALLTGLLEPTNEPYALAKIVGVKLCQAYRAQYGSDFISAMPTNLYGPNDNYDPQSSHVMAALIAKAHMAKAQGAPAFTVWGTGAPRREFLYVDDCADALVFLMKYWSEGQHVNIGVGSDIAISDLAAMIARTVGFNGSIEFDLSKPDGTPRKLVDVARINGLGWQARTALSDGIALAYEDYWRTRTTR